MLSSRRNAFEEPVFLEAADLAFDVFDFSRLSGGTCCLAPYPSPSG